MKKAIKGLLVYVVISLLLSGLLYLTKPNFVLKNDPNNCVQETSCAKRRLLSITEKCKTYQVCKKLNEVNVLYVFMSGFGIPAIGLFIYYLFTKTR